MLFRSFHVRLRKTQVRFRYPPSRTWNFRSLTWNFRSRTWELRSPAPRRQRTMFTIRLAMDTRMDVAEMTVLVVLPMSEFFAFVLFGVT